jgi:hypothetical protein
MGGRGAYLQRVAALDNVVGACPIRNDRNQNAMGAGYPSDLHVHCAEGLSLQLAAIARPSRTGSRTPLDGGFLTAPPSAKPATLPFVVKEKSKLVIRCDPRERDFGDCFGRATTARLCLCIMLDARCAAR